MDHLWPAGPDHSEGVDGHRRWMTEALALARAMQGRVWPNPAVGCVIVRDGDVVGRGQTQFGGRPHAERVALDEAGHRARGATLYVTLEPCCHWGRTPPCADAIVAAGIRSVHACLQDPDPRVDGGGFQRLRDAGIEVSVGLGAEEARGIMEGFFTRIALGRPLVTLADSDPATFGIGDVPDPYDAILETQADGNISLRTRSGDAPADIALQAGMTALEMARHLGKRGLTSILIHPRDPLAQRWRASGLIDHDATRTVPEHEESGLPGRYVM